MNTEKNQTPEKLVLPANRILLKTPSQIIDLEDSEDEEDANNNMVVEKPRTQSPEHEENMNQVSKSSSSSRSKKYATKQEHPLKLAYMSRASSTNKSNCPSISSQVSFRKRKPKHPQIHQNRILGPTITQTPPKPPKMSFISPKNTQETLKTKSLCNSAVSSSFSVSKFGESTTQNPPLPPPSFLNCGYEMKTEHVELSSLRKKVCRKIYEILSREYIQERKEAKRVTLELEKKIHFFFNSDLSKKRYVGIIKTIFKKLKVFYLLTRRLEKSLSETSPTILLSRLRTSVNIKLTSRPVP